MPKDEKYDDIENKENYQYDEDRMVNEGLAGGTVNIKYNQPSIDEATPMSKEERPRDPDDADDKKEKDTDFEIDRMIDEGMAGGQVNEVDGKKQIGEDPPTKNDDK